MNVSRRQPIVYGIRTSVCFPTAQRQRHLHCLAAGLSLASRLHIRLRHNFELSRLGLRRRSVTTLSPPGMLSPRSATDTCSCGSVFSTETK